MTGPRVMLVDDDASIRRLFELALEDEGVELIVCPSAAEALEYLRRQGPVELLITDLMMPGLSGFDLLQRLMHEPALRGGARLVTFSAGLDATAQARLASVDLWRQLGKPASLQALLACVREGTGAATVVARASDARPAQPPQRPSDAPAVEPAEAPTDARQRLAIARHFAGNAVLFHAFETSCSASFAEDLRAADRALVLADWPALRRLAHSLKSVLRTLGYDDLATQAQALEEAALSGDEAALRVCWAGLRETLRALIGVAE